MLTLDEIKQEYNTDLHIFSRSLIREYLQYQILAIVFSHPKSYKLTFLGGTALRIVYNLKRFSEDIDFDNKRLSFDEFREIGEFLKTELERQGYIVEIRMLSKGAFHCYVKFPKILYEQGLSPLVDEKILIQLDTFDQGVDYDSNDFVLNKFDLLKQIKVTPKDVILAQKLWTITQRKRAKGRDFYDIMHLLQSTKPNKQFLEAKFGTSKADAVKELVLQKVKNVDWKKVAKDVEPFLFKAEDSAKILLFEKFIMQVEF
ncbi:MAG: nucleotidyl transferase AbiEii/AbiGii toxin family protein [Candidatus Dojkabacteria bacterium]